MGKRWTKINEVGNVYGQVTITAEAPPGGSQNKTKWFGRCECGNVKEYWAHKLRSGLVKSCGCWRKGNGRNPNALTEQEKIDRATKPRQCSGCKKTKPPEAFSKIVRRRCKQCDRERTKAWMGPDYRYVGTQARYGVDKFAFEAMMKEQGGKCDICGGPPLKEQGYFDIDHDHSKKKGDDGFVRSLLCGNCNMGLGNFQDDIDKMLAAIEYLKKHRENPRRKNFHLTNGEKVVRKRQQRLNCKFTHA